ncbi:TIGR02270 family protein [Archangium lansingense]|uniref:TIGR02270 family protein n=1 Tax=Archangium lansingense TaxID=2995310 RepID=A0ABT4AHG3_9BACT|nr:TIGR02270 family protein [Archangium lansinium]MCY1080751.1 TIGR02270 family protein [Archangium lansinium]
MALRMMDIYEEHLDEAAFLWSQWERALAAPDHDLEDTAALEERLLAHLDGLVIGGAPVARELLMPALGSEDPPRIASAFWAQVEAPEGMSLEETVNLLVAAPPKLLPSLQRALELSGRQELGGALLPLLRRTEPVFPALALHVLAFRGEAGSEASMEWLRHADGSVVAAALRGMRPLPREMDSLTLSRLLADPRPGVAEAALEAGLVAGARVAWNACCQAVEGRTGAGRLPLALLAVGGEEGNLKPLLERAGSEELRADAIWALGFSGRVAAAEACLELMGAEPMAPLAGEAFCAITGLRLEGPYVLPRMEEEAALPPLEEELDQDLELRPESALPMPDRQAMAAWWMRMRKDFARGTRYLRGRVFNNEGLLEELERGPMRRRHVHALELAIRSRGACLLQTRAFAQRQRTELRKARAEQARLSATPFARIFGG